MVLDFSGLVPYYRRVQILNINRMTVNLEDFVDKEVIVTLANGNSNEDTVRRNRNMLYPYFFARRAYTSKGHYNLTMPGPLDIVDIQLKTKLKKLNMTKLSEKPLINLLIL